MDQGGGHGWCGRLYRWDMDPFDIPRSWNIEIIYGGDNNLIYSLTSSRRIVTPCRLIRPHSLPFDCFCSCSTLNQRHQFPDLSQEDGWEGWQRCLICKYVTKTVYSLPLPPPLCLLHAPLRQIGSGRIFDEHTTCACWLVCIRTYVRTGGQLLKEHHTQSVNWAITINILWEI